MELNLAVQKLPSSQINRHMANCDCQVLVTILWKQLISEPL